jgi:hypothetical protein
MPIESTPGPDRRAHALQQSVLGGSCRAVHGHFRAHVGTVSGRARDQNGSTTCLGSPKSCPKAEGLVECQSKAPQGRTGGPTPSSTVCWRGLAERYTVTFGREYRTIGGDTGGEYGQHNMSTGPTPTYASWRTWAVCGFGHGFQTTPQPA